MPMRRRLAKTLIYRLSTIIFIQIFIWFTCHKVEFNLIVGIGEIIRFIYYYIYDWLWDRQKFRCPLCGTKLIQDEDDPRFWCRNENCEVSWLQIVDYDDMPLDLLPV